MQYLKKGRASSLSRQCPKAGWAVTVTGAGAAQLPPKPLPLLISRINSGSCQRCCFLTLAEASLLRALVGANFSSCCMGMGNGQPLPALLCL